MPDNAIFCDLYVHYTLFSNYLVKVNKIGSDKDQSFFGTLLNLISLSASPGVIRTNPHFIRTRNILATFQFESFYFGFSVYVHVVKCAFYIEL